MSCIHFVRCAHEDDRDLVGRRLAALVATAAEGLAWSPPGPLVLVTDHPTRGRVRGQWDSFTGPVRHRLAEQGWNLTEAPSTREAGPTAAELPGQGKHFDTVPVGDAVAGAQALVSLSRVSLHEKSGLEGVLHGLAVGCTSVDGLVAIQSGVQPHVERDMCGGCGMCVTYCGNEGIRHNGHVAVVRPENCLGCGDCLAECFMEALKFPEGSSRTVMERVAETAGAVTTRFGGRALHGAIIIPEPERRSSMAGHHVPQPEVGLLVGTDPLAVETAAADLVEAALGESLGGLSRCPEDPRHLLRHGAGIGMGDGAYDLVEHAPETLIC